MDTVSKLQELAANTSCEFTIEYNPHKSNYETVEEYVSNLDDFFDDVGTLDHSRDIWTLQIYPRTPVGFIAGISNDLEALVEWGIKGAKEY